MATYVARRILQTIPILVLTSVFVFLVLHLVPGDPALVLAGSDAEPEVLQAVRKEMGLDQPLPFQYLTWVEHVVRGDFGKSYISRLPTLDLLVLKLPATLELTLAALILALLIAVPTGILAAVRRRGAADLAISTGGAREWAHRARNRERDRARPFSVPYRGGVR
jgi:peptide/nickel transport system permease protein